MRDEGKDKASRPTSKEVPKMLSLTKDMIRRIGGGSEERYRGLAI